MITVSIEKQRVSIKIIVATVSHGEYKDALVISNV